METPRSVIVLERRADLVEERHEDEDRESADAFACCWRSPAPS
jgi:hypothetical protein